MTLFVAEVCTEPRGKPRKEASAGKGQVVEREGVDVVAGPRAPQALLNPPHRIDARAERHTHYTPHMTVPDIDPGFHARLGALSQGRIEKSRIEQQRRIL